MGTERKAMMVFIGLLVITAGVFAVAAEAAEDGPTGWQGPLTCEKEGSVKDCEGVFANNDNVNYQAFWFEILMNHMGGGEFDQESKFVVCLSRDQVMWNSTDACWTTGVFHGDTHQSATEEKKLQETDFEEYNYAIIHIRVDDMRAEAHIKVNGRRPSIEEWRYTGPDPLEPGDRPTFCWDTDWATNYVRIHWSGSAFNDTGFVDVVQDNCAGRDELRPDTAGTATFTLEASGPGSKPGGSGDAPVSVTDSISIQVEEEEQLPDLEGWAADVCTGGNCPNSDPPVAGETVRWDWQIKNTGDASSGTYAISCRLDGNEFDFDSSMPSLDPGEIEFSWCETTINNSGSYTFQIYADPNNNIDEVDDSNSSNSESVNFTVEDPPPTASLSASPNPVDSGSTTTLSWSSTNADSCTATQGPGFNTGSATSGSDGSSALTSDTTFSIECNGPGGSDTDSVTVQVGEAADPPTASLSASPNPVDSGNSTTLSWDSTDADSCTATQGPGFNTGGATSGSDESADLTSDATFSIECNGPGGSDTDSVTVGVEEPDSGTSDPSAENLTVTEPASFCSPKPPAYNFSWIYQD